jgi:hypothetical protein
MNCLSDRPCYRHSRKCKTTGQRRSPGVFHRGIRRSRLVLTAVLAWLLLVVGAAADDGNAPNAAPPLAVRELYALAHFGNSYEVMGQCEMRKYLEEVKHWGFNRYGDWFDMQDCSDPFADKSGVTLGHAMWERKKQNFRSAQALGLACDLVICPNHVYVNQCRPELLAVKGTRIAGQLICPSHPEARAIILKNYENLFADLARAGVRLNSISTCPYDFGGCACNKCKPWILTCAKLSRDIHAIAQRHYPGVELNMIGWWWTPEEHQQLADWADREAPGLIKAIYLHLVYGATKTADVRLPKGCRRYTFVHIGYADQAKPVDIYGHFGPVIAPVRLPQTVRDISALGDGGFMAYSEGVSDDVNKALLAGLASGRFQTADEVLRAYAQRYFDADARQTAAWAQWLTPWGRPFDVDFQKSAQQLALLKKNGQWREKQWELKLELFRLNKSIGTAAEWTPARLEAVEQFFRVREQIQRGLWGLTLQRHVFATSYLPLPWYRSWAKYVGSKAASMGKEQ